MAEPIVIHAETCNGDTYEIRYYRASDYDALAAENAALREWQRRIVELLTDERGRPKTEITTQWFDQLAELIEDASRE